MAAITRLEARYVEKSKLESLLQRLFGDPPNYSVKVCAANPVYPCFVLMSLRVKEVGWKLRHQESSLRLDNYSSITGT